MSSSELNSKLLSRSFLFGRFFTIGTYNLPPYTSYTNVSLLDGRINDVDGMVHQIVLYLAFKYGFTFEYMSSVDSAFGSFINGSWNGLVGMLSRGEIDFIATGFTITYARSTVVGLTVPFDIDERALLMPYPELKNLGNIDAVVKPFQYEIWISIAISVVVITTVIWKILSLENVMLKNQEGATKIKKISLAYSFRSLFHFQYIRNVNFRSPVRIILYVWGLVSIFFSNAYSSTLISYLMTPRYHQMIDSAKDIVNMQRPVFMVQKYSSHEENVLGADSGVLFQIAESLRKYPELRLNPKTAYKEAPDLVVKQNKVFAAIKAVLLAMMEKDLKDTGQCRLYLANKPWGVHLSAIALPKFSPVILIFNHEINWLRQVGLLDYWHRQYWPRRNRCNEPLTVNLERKNFKKLTLVDLTKSAFFLLGCGCSASFVAFILELVVKKAHRTRQKYIFTGYIF